MILHITNDFSGSAVYKNLIKEIDNLGSEQVVYVPVRNEILVNKNKIDFNMENSRLIYSNIISQYSDRFFYKRKINKIKKDIESKVDLSKIACIYAHTWYSDGGVAYLLSLKYKIPYIIAVRNTDVNIFLKYFFYHRSFGRKIMLNAKRIICISAVYKERLLINNSLKKIKDDIVKNILVIPNGVDQFWLDNCLLKSKNSNENINLLYVGNFNKGKNIVNLINAFNEVQLERKMTLTLVGGKGSHEAKVLDLVNKNTNITFLGEIRKKEDLLKIYQNHQYFVMPSRHETFGLVYIEALLQGLPILYTKNEGIDGFYDDSIGEKTVNASKNEIVKSLKLLIEKNYEFTTDNFQIVHNWRNIAKRYINIFENIV